MSLPKSVRFDENLEKEITEYLDQNELKFSQLINLAVAKFIKEPNSIELKPVNLKDFKNATEKAFSKHKEAMDKLK